MGQKQPKREGENLSWTKNAVTVPGPAAAALGLGPPQFFQRILTEFRALQNGMASMNEEMSSADVESFLRRCQVLKLKALASELDFKLNLKPEATGSPGGGRPHTSNFDSHGTSTAILRRQTRPGSICEADSASEEPQPTSTSITRSDSDSDASAGLELEA